MIIQCKSCSRKFVVKDRDIPKLGREVKCGYCSVTWHQMPVHEKAEIIEIKKDLSEKDAINQSKTNDKVKKSIVGKKIIKTIFVKNKIINYLLK